MKCEFCDECDPDSPACGHEVRFGHVELVCTRLEGHEGEHVACGTHHKIAIWHYDKTLYE